MSLSELVQLRDAAVKQIKDMQHNIVRLKKNKMVYELAIMEILEQTQQTGFVSEGKLYAPVETKAYRKRKREDKIAQLEALLRDKGVVVDQHVLDSVFGVFKHDAYVVDTLKQTKCA